MLSNAQNLIQKTFPSRISVSPQEACRAVFNWPNQTTNTRLWQHRKGIKPFPFSLIRIDSKDMVRICDLQAIIDGQPVQPVQPKSKIGRPTKRSVLERERLEKAAATASAALSE